MAEMCLLSPGGERDAQLAAIAAGRHTDRCRGGGWFLLVLVLERFFAAEKLIPMLFVLGVFIVSLQTEGYLWGVAASLIGVLLVNYAFMFPYYAIDLLTR